MLSLFRTNHLYFGVFFLFLILLLRLPGYFFPELLRAGDLAGGIFSKMVWAELEGKAIWKEAVVIFFIFIQANLVSFLVNDHRISRENNLFPGYVLVLFYASSPLFLTPSGLLLANTFYLLAIWEMLKTYRVPTCADSIFNMGVWLAIGSLFYFSITVLLLWAIFGLNVLRAFKLRELLMVIAGFLAVYIIVGVWFFWKDQWTAFVEGHFVENIGFLHLQHAGNKTYEWIALAFCGLLIGICLASFGQYTFKQNIQVQKKISVLFLAMLVSALSMFLQAPLTAQHLLILALPISIFISANFYSLPPRWAETFNFLWISGILLLQIFPLLF